ncbi:MAG TPA: hypothetical protein PKC38_09170, partial [Chitinophagales bacterium]|nr:hypothetical protein [Chitinophagales bacterium]
NFVFGVGRSYGAEIFLKKAKENLMAGLVTLSLKPNVNLKTSAQARNGSQPNMIAYMISKLLPFTISAIDGTFQAPLFMPQDRLQP